MNLSKIAFLKGGIYIPYKKETKLDSICPEVIMFNYELIKLGYTLSQEDMYFLDETSVKTHGNDIFNNIYEFLGKKETWQPFHKGFPYSVLSKPEIELFQMQMVHYLEGWEPEPNKEGEEGIISLSREEKNMYESAFTLKLYTEKDICEIYKKVLGMNQSISSFEKESIVDLLNEGKDIIPDKIPFKENLALVVSTLGAKGIKYCTGINDVLRGIMYSLGMPVTLVLPPKMVKGAWRKMVENPDRLKYKFPNIPRAKRREYMDWIDLYYRLKNHSSVDIDDLKKSKNFWIRLAEKLHPSEYEQSYPFAYLMFCRIKSNKLKGFYSDLHEAYKIGQDEVLNVLSKRPGEFIRRFDSVFRREGYSKVKTLNALVDLKSNPSTKVILEFLEYFSNRDKEMPTRSVTIPGSRDKFLLPMLEPLRTIDVEEIRKYSLVLLQENYEKQESLSGKTVVIDENLEDVRLPRDMRTMSESLKVISRGTALDFPKDTKYLRLFTFWVDPDGTEDLDLSACFLGEDFKNIFNIGWNQHLKFKDFVVHSGDVRHRQGNCAEYVDIDVQGAIDNKVRYVCVDVEDYVGGGFHRLENSSGICAIEKISTIDDYSWYPGKKGENVLQAFKLSTSGTTVLAFVVDLVERKVYFIDQDLRGIPVGSYHTERKVSMVKDLIGFKPFVSVSELLKINASARGAELMSIAEFSKLENPDMENFIIYTKDDVIRDFSLLKDILE